MPKERAELYSFSYGISFVEVPCRLLSHKLNVPSTKDEWNKALSDSSGIVDNTP